MTLILLILFIFMIVVLFLHDRVVEIKEKAFQKRLREGLDFLNSDEFFFSKNCASIQAYNGVIVLRTGLEDQFIGNDWKRQEWER